MENPPKRLKFSSSEVQSVYFHIHLSILKSDQRIRFLVVLVKNKLESRFPCLKVKRGEVEIYDGPQKRPKDGVENRSSRLYVESNRANGHSETTLLL